jgi:hypothetical protein
MRLTIRPCSILGFILFLIALALGRQTIRDVAPENPVVWITRVDFGSYAQHAGE